jgi:hypothetical protein
MMQTSFGFPLQWQLEAEWKVMSGNISKMSSSNMFYDPRGAEYTASAALATFTVRRTIWYWITLVSILAAWFAVALEWYFLPNLAPSNISLAGET